MPETPSIPDQPQPFPNIWNRTREQLLARADSRLDELLEIIECVRLVVAILRDGGPCRQQLAAAAQARLERLNQRLENDLVGADVVALDDAAPLRMLTPAQRDNL